MSLRRRLRGILAVLPWWCEGEGEGEGLVPAAEMRRLLEMERARTERTGLAFSLVAFPLPSGEPGRQLLPRLAAALHARVRAIDTVGWLDEGRVGALLPETAPEGAHRLGDEIGERLAAQGWAVHPKVCVFSVRCRPSPRSGGGGARAAASAGTGPQLAQDEEPVEAFFSVRPTFWKRAMDVAGSAIGLALLWPVMLLVALAVKLASPGPALLRQERVGQGGRVFALLKFRSMSLGQDAGLHRGHMTGLIDSDRPMSKMENDPRIFPLGRLLRRTYLDELPQLINVLLGDMSLVGPRPCLPYEACEYRRWHARRFDLLPGMTGLWQVSGKNRRSFQEMIRLDIAYALTMSPWLDAKILLLTPLAVLAGLRGAQEKAGLGREMIHERPT